MADGAPDAFLADEGCTVMGTVGRLATVRISSLSSGLFAFLLIVRLLKIAYCGAYLLAMVPSDQPAKAHCRLGLERYVYWRATATIYPPCLPLWIFFAISR